MTATGEMERAIFAAFANMALGFDGRRITE
nr:MAG TPA: hypothetical protein [Caudoviricetes sp.]